LLLIKKLSMFGGMFGTSEEVIDFHPHKLTTADMKSAFMFFEMIIFKQVARHFGVSLKLPD